MTSRNSISLSVGQRVKVVTELSKQSGRTGTVEEIDPENASEFPITVCFAGAIKEDYYPDELEVVQ